MSHEIKQSASANGVPAPSNLARLTEALACGRYMPVKLEGTSAVGFVVRLDDAPFGPVAVVHVPGGQFVQILYRDPEELVLMTSSDSLRGN